MKHLAVAVKSQHVALRDDTGVALLASLRCSGDVGFDSVVGPAGWSDVGARAAEQRGPFSQLGKHLVTVLIAHAVLQRHAHPCRRR